MYHLSAFLVRFSAESSSDDSSSESAAQFIRFEANGSAWGRWAIGWVVGGEWWLRDTREWVDGPLGPRAARFGKQGAVSFGGLAYEEV